MCICKDSFYDAGDGWGCQPCPAGYKCVGGEKIICPIHTFQENQGATHCDNCVSTGDENGIYNQCSDNQQLEWCQPGKGTALKTNCVPCSHCKRPYLTPKGGTPQKDCYQSN